MNQQQYNNHNVRQVTPEEMQQQLQGLTQEELQKTQVLNLKDVEEAARFEKITSKKPAIIIAIIGALFLTFGTTFQIAKTLSAKNNDRVIENRETEALPEENKNLICTLQETSQGTDTLMTIDYFFENNKLTEFTKTFTVSVVPNDPNGPNTYKLYVSGFAPFIKQADGYTITVTPNADNTQLTSVVNAKLSEINLEDTKFLEQQNKLFKVSITRAATAGQKEHDFPMNTEKSVIKKDMTAIGYTCE